MTKTAAFHAGEAWEKILAPFDKILKILTAFLEADVFYSSCIDSAVLFVKS